MLAMVTLLIKAPMSARKKARTSSSDGLSQLEQLSAFTTVVADTGELEAIRKYQPTDATTNPSLLLKAAKMEQYDAMVQQAIEYGLQLQGLDHAQRMERIMDKLAVNFGTEITRLVPGYVSTELDARLSFDTEACIERARRIIAMYEEAGVDRSRILIKIASTWEGIQAAAVLQREGITCNMTLLFSMPQAIAAAEAGATLVSPFVGRILDWYKANTAQKSYTAEEDPGVISVRSIYQYYKKFGYNTIVMGASFRNKEEILALAGCDRLTISPQLLEELQNSNDHVERVLDPESAGAAYQGEKIEMDERTFRLMLNDDPMATAKLAEGIRGFADAAQQLELILETRLAQQQCNGFGHDQLTQLAAITTLVADTGEIDLIKKAKPTDATTNPSLLYKAAGMPEYKALVHDAIQHGKSIQNVTDQERLNITVDRMAVNFGCEILKHVPGYVSTEVDARLSFDTEGTVARARRIISMYEAAGVGRDRILIKIASTWEGIRAAEILERDGITCNMTLLFNLAQAVAAAEAGATLISPFVGRILDWYKASTGRTSYPAEEDPGVISVRSIYQYYKKFGYNTIVMGASFRNKEEILALAGCDRLTIAPKLLDELKASNEAVVRVLEPTKSAAEFNGQRIEDLNEHKFRWLMNQDPMATDKLAEGIRKFAEDLVSLEQVIAPQL